MAGAIIPDDWDGSTFICQKIEWPASPKWQAILLGQVSEPSNSWYWDADTGDVDDAAEAVDDAFALTVPTIYEEDCDVAPHPLVPAFHASKTATQAIPANIWTTITWDNLVYDENSPEFDLALNAHTPDNPPNLGVWHYDFYVRLSPLAFIRVRAMKLPGSIVKSFAGVVSDTRLGTSFDVVHVVPRDELRMQIITSVATTIFIASPDTRFQGHYVGPVSE